MDSFPSLAISIVMTAASCTIYLFNNGRWLFLATYQDMFGVNLGAGRLCHDRFACRRHAGTGQPEHEIGGADRTAKVVRQGPL